MSGSHLRFGLLGPLLLTVGGVPLNLGTPKQRAVFAMLLINRNRPVATESLVDAAWDQEPVPAARTSIQSYISNLRKLIGGAGVDPLSVLASAPPGYRLNVLEGDCDLDRFLTEKNNGIQAAAAGRFDAASSHLTTALAEWRGPVLDDLGNFAFVQTFATALMEDHMLVQIARAEAEIACGRASEVIGDLERLAAEHPYREPLWAQLITAYYVSERQSDALNAYLRLKTALAEDLGIDPGPSVNALHSRILRQERLHTKRAARNTATATHAMAGAYAFTRQAAVAGLRDAHGNRYPIQKSATRIGRLADNDLVIDDEHVSRHHAVIVDTGGSFVITDLQSANGVLVQGRQLRPSATLAEGDHISICGHEFVFEIQR